MLRVNGKRKAAVGLVIFSLLVVFAAFQNFGWYSLDYRDPITARYVANNLYGSILARQPDSNGLNYWTSQLIGGMPVKTVVETMATSKENLDRLSRLSNEAFLTSMYVDLFRRNPDPGGYAYWLGQLNSGLPRAALIQTFVRSPDFDIAKILYMSTGFAYNALDTMKGGQVVILSMNVAANSTYLSLIPVIYNNMMTPVQGTVSILCTVRDASNQEVLVQNVGFVTTVSMLPGEKVSAMNLNTGGVKAKAGRYYIGSCNMRGEKPGTNAPTSNGPLLGATFFFSFTGM